MTAAGQAQAPKWLRRSNASQPFVATVCSGGNLDGALETLGDILGEAQVDASRRLAANACDVTFESQPDRAWALLRNLRKKLSDTDVYVQPATERGKRLLICDMDMTIVAAETLDEVAASLGMGERIAAITARAMHGEIDFNAALRERIQMLAGQPEQVFHDVARQVRLNPGAEQLVDGARASGVHTILISGGFAQVAEAVARQLGFDEVHCNRLELESGRLTGRVRDPIINADLKCQVLQQRARALGFTLRDCCAIGDGANDLPMLTAAGLGIGYHPKPVLRAATSCHIDVSGLDSALYFMGVDPAADP